MANPILNIFQGDTVNFTNNSLGDITDYSWDFPGGSPTGSTSTNPSVVYNNVGDFSVSLTTDDSYSVSNTELKTGIIKVAASPWGVDFEFSIDSPIFMGEILFINNTSIGDPNYSEWTFPSDGALASGVTFGGVNSKDPIGPLSYMNWETLTGSHAASSGTVYISNVNLFSSSPFAIGNKNKQLGISKLGPVEEISEIYNYIPIPYASDLNSLGSIASTPYGNLFNDISNSNRFNGLGYSYSTKIGGEATGGYEEPYTLSDGSVLNKIEFKTDFANTYWGATGPTGLYYPHVNNEVSYIRGRAFSPFNIEFNGRYRVNNLDTLNAIGGTASPDFLGANIEEGNYSSDIKIPSPLANEIVNPEFALIRDTFYDDSINPFQRSYLSLYSRGNLVNGKESNGTAKIHKTTIENLLKNPIGLPTPGPTAYFESPPTLGIITSADTHIGADSRITQGQWARFYPDTLEITQEKINIGGTGGTGTFIGKYPCIPSQYILPDEPSLSFIEEVGVNNTPNSSIPPLGIDIKVDYWDGDSVTIPVYFGLPDTQARNDGPITVPESIDPVGSIGPSLGATACAQAYGNDSVDGSWILVEDTQYGIGIASYINAYISDPDMGLTGGLNDLIAVADEYWTLPTPYSDNITGTITSGGTGGPNRAGLSLEIRNPLISSVTVKESYGIFRNGILTESTYYGLVSSKLLNTPMTWDFGRFNSTGDPEYPQYIDIEPWIQTKSTYLGISSHMKTFSYGALSENHTEDGIDRRSGIKIGGSL